MVYMYLHIQAFLDFVYFVIFDNVIAKIFSIILFVHGGGL